MTSALVVAMTMVLGAPALKGPPRGSLPAIEGDWELIEWIQNGTPVGVTPGTGVEFCPDGKRLWRDGAGPPDVRGYKVYPDTKPAAIDLIRPAGPANPDVFPSIYKVEDDRLTLCIAQVGRERPTQFDSSRESGWMVMTFKRLPKKK